MRSRWHCYDWQPTLNRHECPMVPSRFPLFVVLWLVFRISHVVVLGATVHANTNMPRIT